MKKIYLSILAVLSVFAASAQLTLTKAANEPVIGDLDKRTGYDSSIVIPKNTGTGQVWNFTSFVSSMSAGSYTTSYINPTSAPNASLFPTATIASFELGGNNYEFNKSSGSIYEYLGRYDVGSPELMVFSNPGTLRSWPISYGSISTDSWAALQTNSSGTMSMVGNVTVAATGAGTVILPNGKVHANCLQVIESITLTVTSGTMVVSGNMKNIFYYSSSSKHPIFEMYYESFPGDPLKFGASANTDALYTSVNENVDVVESAVTFPNPVKDVLHFSIPLNEAISTIEVMDLQGRNVLSMNYANSINVESLEQGLYVVKLNYADKVVYQRFVKTN